MVEEHILKTFEQKALAIFPDLAVEASSIARKHKGNDVCSGDLSHR